MPVHHTYRGGILRIIVDGDYTTAELERAGERALADPKVDPPVPVLLDLSGAAGMDGKTPDEIRETCHFLDAESGTVTRLAILTSGGLEVDEHDALETRSFQRSDEAVEWLGGTTGPQGFTLPPR